MSVVAGTKIYYTGDMANDEGVFVASPVVGGGVDLVELDGDRVFRSVRHIGATYDGTCNTRFVLQSAREFYRDEMFGRLQQLRTA